MPPSGFAVGSNLTDLGRNLIAQETTRNALQAALAAAAAQQGVARTQAGASRYSTDAQSQGNQLTALMRIIEQQRLRDSTGEEVRLKEGDLALRKLLGERQFAPNDPIQLDADRKNALAIATLNADAQRAINQRVDPRYATALLDSEIEIKNISDMLPGLEAKANFASDALFNSRHDFWTGGKREIADYQKAALAIPSDPGYGEFGTYLVPSIDPDGRVKFKARIPTPIRTTPPIPVPPPNPVIDEEYGLEGIGNVPRGTNDQVVVRPPIPTPAFPVDQVVPQSRSSVLGGFNVAELARRIGQASAQDPSALSETAEAALRQRVSVLMLEIRQPTTPPARKAQIIQELQRIRSLKPQ